MFLRLKGCCAGAITPGCKKLGEATLPHETNPIAEEPKTLPRWVLLRKAFVLPGPGTEVRQRGGATNVDEAPTVHWAFDQGFTSTSVSLQRQKRGLRQVE